MERASKATEDQHCPVRIGSLRQACVFETRIPEVEAEQSRGSPGPRELQMEFCSALPLLAYISSSLLRGGGPENLPEGLCYGWVRKGQPVWGTR